jgi:hypothetical protein
MSTASAAVRASLKGRIAAPPSGLLFLNDYTTGITITNALANAPGTRTITGTAPTMTVSSVISTNHSGSTATFSGYGNAGNNGSFTIVDVTGSSFTILNPAGIAEVGPAGSRIDVLGNCSAATDLIGGRVFSQPGTSLYMFAVNKTLVPGKTVLCTGLASQFLGRFLARSADPTLAGALDGTQPFSMFCYIYPTGYSVQGGFTAWQQFDDGANVSRAAARVAGASDMRCLTSNSGGTLDTLFNGFVLPVNAWQLWTVTNSGTQAQFYLDASLRATAASAARPRAGLNRVALSNCANGVEGLVGTRHYRVIDGAASRVMTLAEVQQLLAYCQSVV